MSKDFFCSFINDKNEKQSQEKSLCLEKEEEEESSIKSLTTDNVSQKPIFNLNSNSNFNKSVLSTKESSDKTQTQIELLNNSSKSKVISEKGIKKRKFKTVSLKTALRKKEKEKKLIEILDYRKDKKEAEILFEKVLTEIFRKENEKNYSFEEKNKFVSFMSSNKILFNEEIIEEFLEKKYFINLMNWLWEEILPLYNCYINNDYSNFNLLQLFIFNILNLFDYFSIKPKDLIDFNIFNKLQKISEVISTLYQKIDLDSIIPSFIYCKTFVLDMVEKVSDKWKKEIEFFNSCNVIMEFKQKKFNNFIGKKRNEPETEKNKNESDSDERKNLNNLNNYNNLLCNKKTKNKTKIKNIRNNKANEKTPLDLNSTFLSKIDS